MTKDTYEEQIKQLEQHIAFLNKKLLKASVKNKVKKSRKIWWKIILDSLKLKKKKDKQNGR